MSIKVLSVEDEPLAANHVRQILGREYEVLEASDGREAWGLMGKTLPDLVITDADAPRMNGWDLARRISLDRETSGIPVIVIVKKKRITARILGKLMGISAVLKRPVDPAELRNAVQAALESSRKRG